jgi:hypothetical protein
MFFYQENSKKNFFVEMKNLEINFFHDKNLGLLFLKIIVDGRL